MTSGQANSLRTSASTLRPSTFPFLGLYLMSGVIGLTLVAFVVFPRGYTLAVIGDTLQVALQATAAFLTLKNAMGSRGRIRVFWLLLFLGVLMWLSSQVVWSLYELWFRLPVPDSSLVDALLFVKLVPLAAAATLQLDNTRDSDFQTFGLLDLCILILASLYLFAFYVYSYRLLPGATAIYNFHFDVAHSVGNQVFVIATGIACFRASAYSRVLFRLLFLCAACYAFGSDLSNSAIDLGRYYTGSLYDLPLNASMAALVWLSLAGRPVLLSSHSEAEPEPAHSAPNHRFSFASSNLAMLVTVSMPAIGLWVVATHSPSDPLFAFRLRLTLVAIFFLTLLLSVKQDILSASLLGSLQRLSGTYSSIGRFKGHLLQTEKLTTLGGLVASASRQIAEAMIQVQQEARAITGRSDPASRSSVLASKIGQYAQRTDSLAENMQRFAQETPLEIAPVEVKPLLESALHLSRIGKLPNLLVEVEEQGAVPPVLADSSQLLHVFLQILSNAIDALQEIGGGQLAISIRSCEPQVCIQFSDTGPGIKHPEHVFEPFFTTKPVGKGTGLGLSTCYGIIRQHNGDISCGNRLEGGAHFTIFLPAADPLLANDLPANPVAVQDAR